jgi:hypothetical protein
LHNFFLNAQNNSASVRQVETSQSEVDRLLEQVSGQYAVVAGGSKGIGYAIAEALAKRNFNLVLIARHQPALDTAKEQLEKKYGVHIEVLKMDLAKEMAADSIANWCISKNIKVKMLCNVAGYGGPKDYLKLPLDSLRYMIRLNIESTMALTNTLLPILEKNKPAYIMNVASMAGLGPMPDKNIYSATKSAVISFSYALRHQLKKRGVSVSCLTPGPVFTKPEIVTYTKDKLGWFGMQMAVPPEKVGEVAVKNTLRGKMMIVPGTLAKISSFFIRLLPKSWIVALYGISSE